MSEARIFASYGEHMSYPRSVREMIQRIMETEGMQPHGTVTSDHYLAGLMYLKPKETKHIFYTVCTCFFFFNFSRIKNGQNVVNVQVYNYISPTYWGRHIVFSQMSVYHSCNTSTPGRAFSKLSTNVAQTGTMCRAHETLALVKVIASETTV